MHFIWAIIVGFIAGLVARFLMPGRDPGGLIVTTILGIAGALIATYLGRAAGWYGPGEGSGFIASVIGAMILLLLYRIFLGRRHRVS